MDRIEDWFGDRSVKASRDRLPAGLLGAEADLLCDIGLPIRVGPVFEADPPEVFVDRGSSRSLLRLGDDLGTWLCLDLATHQVVSVDPERELPERFVNSTLSDFLRFLCRLDRFWAKTMPLEDDEAIAAVSPLREEMRAIDAAALGSEDHWWSVVLEQMSDGLL